MVNLTVSNDLQSMPFDEIKNITAEPNEMWAMRKKFFLDVLNKNAPLTKIKVKNKAARLSEKESKSDWVKIHQSRIRNLRASYYRDKIEENKGNIKGTWKILKQAINKDSKGSDMEMLKVNDRKVKGNDEIAELFN